MFGVYGLKIREIGILLPNNQRQHRTLHIQKDVLPYGVGFTVWGFQFGVDRLGVRVDSLDFWTRSWMKVVNKCPRFQDSSFFLVSISDHKYLRIRDSSLECRAWGVGFRVLQRRLMSQTAGHGFGVSVVGV